MMDHRRTVDEHRLSDRENDRNGSAVTRRAEDEQSFVAHPLSHVGTGGQARGFRLSAGTIVDATLISAPTSTKNQDRAQDPEMGTTKKGGQWLYGMKAHIGVDQKTKLIHTVVATLGNAADKMMLRHLLHGRERRV